jgi:hypothetical protein
LEGGLQQQGIVLQNNGWEQWEPRDGVSKQALKTWWKKTELRESTSTDMGEEEREWYNMDDGYTLDLGLSAEWEMDGDNKDGESKNTSKDKVGDDNKEGNDDKEMETESKEGGNSGGVTAGNVDERSEGDDGGGKKTRDVKERRPKRHKKMG